MKDRLACRFPFLRLQIRFPRLFVLLRGVGFLLVFALAVRLRVIGLLVRSFLPHRLIGVGDASICAG